MRSTAQPKAPSGEIHFADETAQPKAPSGEIHFAESIRSGFTLRVNIAFRLSGGNPSPAEDVASENGHMPGMKRKKRPLS